MQPYDWDQKLITKTKKVVEIVSSLSFSVYISLWISLRIFV